MRPPTTLTLTPNENARDEHGMTVPRAYGARSSVSTGLDL